MSDSKTNNQTSGMSAKEANEKNQDSTKSVKEPTQDDDMKAFEGRREERRRSVEHAFKDSMETFN